MVLDIKRELFEWLVEYGAVSGPLPPKGTSVVQLDAQVTASLENGVCNFMGED